MEPEKRKRRDDDVEVDDGKKDKRKGSISGGESAVSDKEEEEVEEFFAILRRIHVAVKYFEKGNGGGRKLTMNNEWKPSFLLQDFEGDNDVKSEGKTEDLEEDSGLDLNLEPVFNEKRN
ncbi:hypothetical protein CCACVL1_07430 [Corchorus capsularis]|uniref:Uncharacterized protein n=1 Tax=Corchorus capsularis TaxID=210143 RepID=A0A1R3J608_COCAP|nr:hypothetical protein CCACVL1_07430 [Corchorus capsularis]